MNEPNSSDLFEYLAWFRLQMFDEVRKAEELYGEPGAQLVQYYTPELQRYEAKPRREINRYTRTREYFPSRRIGKIGKAHVLDCGCGLGTESLLFSLLGADVIALDLKPDRLELARMRQEFWSTKVGRPLNVDFQLENLFDLDFNEEFDLIWVKEAISHIHPLPEFYAFALKSLKKGGELLVTDPNAEKASTRKSIDSTRVGDLIKTFPHPRTGEPIAYADERILTIPELTGGMAEAGFDIGEVEIYMAGTSSPPRWFWKAFSRPLNRCLPLSRRLGSEFCAAGIKP